MIDLCVALDGPMVKWMLPFFLDSLARKNDMSHVTVHILDRTHGASVSRWIGDWIKKWPAVNLTYTNGRSVKDPVIAATGAYELAAEHMAKTMEWQHRNCGGKPWVAFVHYDIEFKTDWISRVKDLAWPNVAQIGRNGMVAYRRQALDQCWVGLRNWHIANRIGLFLNQDYNGNLVVRGRNDPRCTDCSIPVIGWDIGELMELNLQELGWQIIPDNSHETLARLYNHFGGSTYGHARRFDGHVARANEVLQRLGLEKIP